MRVICSFFIVGLFLSFSANASTSEVQRTTGVKPALKSQQEILNTFHAYKKSWDTFRTGKLKSAKRTAKKKAVAVKVA